ncbi:MAG: DsbA family protein, partial [Myxococcaceae bacterium]
SFSKGRAKLKPDERMCHGTKDAKLSVVEFSDFECPHCLAALPVVESLVKGGKAKVCWLPFPLAFPHSQLTAQAALFARDGGKFWPVHDALFEQQMTMAPEVIHSVLTKNGLNVADFKKAVASGKYTAEINGAKDSGRAGGVSSTPTLFLEGRRYDLPLTPELLEHTVDDEREWQANNRGWAAD